MDSMRLFAVPNLPLFQPGDDVAAAIVESLSDHGDRLVAGDIVVIAQKIISKAEGRLVRLCDIQPGAEAREISASCCQR